MSAESEHLIEQSEADDFMARIMSNLDGGKDAEILRLRLALRMIARKKKMDACAAVSMRAIALTALSSPDGAKNNEQEGQGQ